MPMNQDDRSDFRFVMAHIFAALAPAPAPHWSPARIHEIPHLRRSPIEQISSATIEKISEQDRETLRSWFRDGCFDLPEALQPIADEALRLQREQELEVERMRLENEVAHAVSWRWHFAAKMLASMPKELEE